MVSDVAMVKPWQSTVGSLERVVEACVMQSVDARMARRQASERVDAEAF
jgi:hypothetical protein